VAWAITNAMADYQDVYVERLRRHDTGVLALGPDGWREASVHVGTIEVAGVDPVQVEVVETDRGPVIAGGPEFRPNDDITVAMRIITRKGSNRVAREAFEFARTRPRKKVTAAHKEPVYRLACGMFAEECRKVAKEFPDVTFEESMIDTISMKLVMNPQQYDVVVTTNQFGDILTDIGAGLVGGLGLAPGLCVGEKQAMAQATHGSAPDIAGRNIANPYAMIVSGQMLFDWLGRKHAEPKAVEAARVMEQAVERVIREKKALTGDLGGKATTRQMGDAIAAAV
jgi:3-isopropylmalate dehydrogenase